MIDFRKVKIIDISPVISKKTAVFPGDESYQRKVSLNLHEGDNITLSSITSTVHIGAHADAPSHYDKDGASIDQRDLSIYLGLCQVIHAKGKGRIYPKDIEAYDIQAPRILFYTDSYDAETWTNEFRSLSPELITDLHAKGVILVGIDTPSVDPADSKDLETHATLSKFDCAVLEGLILNHVQEGLYNLIALPLKLKDAEASPVRAILVS